MEFIYFISIINAYQTHKTNLTTVTIETFHKSKQMNYSLQDWCTRIYNLVASCQARHCHHLQSVYKQCFLQKWLQMFSSDNCSPDLKSRHQLLHLMARFHESKETVIAHSPEMHRKTTFNTKAALHHVCKNVYLWMTGALCVVIHHSVLHVLSLLHWCYSCWNFAVPQGLVNWRSCWQTENVQLRLEFTSRG